MGSHRVTGTITDYELTGEFRHPRKGDLFLPHDLPRVERCKGDWTLAERYIVRERPAQVRNHIGSATFEELSAELMRRFEGHSDEEALSAPYDQEKEITFGPGLKGEWFPLEFHVDQRGEAYAILIEDGEERMTEEDAREAALVILTQIALNEELHHMDRIEAARTILKYGAYEL